jgi:hypothetical protein
MAAILAGMAKEKAMELPVPYDRLLCWDGRRLSWI